MSVTERLMGVGAWSVDLDPETPRSVLSLLDPATAGFDQIVITDVPVDTAGLADTAVLGLARYSGLYRTLDGRTLSGASLAALLGDESGKAHLHGSTLTYASASLSTVITDEATRAGLYVGTIQALTGYSSAQNFVTPRQVIDAACQALGAEWRVRPDMSVKAGTATYLYGATPELLVLADDEGGRDLTITAVRGQATMSADVEDYATIVLYLLDRDAGTFGYADRTTDYNEPDGGTFRAGTVVVNGSATDGDEDSLAAAHLAQRVLRRSWDVSTDADITVPVGAPVYLWAPDAGLIDTATQLYFRGRTLFPATSRLMGATWPIRAGMGVYLRHKEQTGSPATYLDLSPYYVPESGQTRLEIGAKPRPSS